MAKARSSNAVQRIPALSLSVLILVCDILLLFNLTFQTDLQRYEEKTTWKGKSEKKLIIAVLLSPNRHQIGFKNIPETYQLPIISYHGRSWYGVGTVLIRI